MEPTQNNAHYTVSESNFKTADGLSLFYRHWHPNTTHNTTKAIVLLHRGHEHSGRVAHIADELAMYDTPFFAWDARGNGRSEGERGFSPNFATMIHDLHEFIKHISSTHNIPVENMIVIAQSLGAVTASAWVHDYAPKIKALVLASPAFDIDLLVPFALDGIKLWQNIKGSFFVKSYVKGTQLSHDAQRAESYHNDPLVSLQIASNVLIDVFSTAKRIVSDAGAIITPTLLLISSDDKVVRRKPQEVFFEGLTSPVKEKYILDGFYHDTLGETERAKAFDLIKKFIARIENSTAKVDLYKADKEGFTFDEYKQLSQPLPSFSVKNWYYAITRLSLNTIGVKASQGIKLGGETGFDSGSSLDYVYKNTPKGIGLLGALGIGKIMDKGYLNSIGWRGIRVRKIHLEKLIGECISKLVKVGMPVRIVDVAAGHGRYVLDAIAPHLDKVEQVLLRDFSDINVKAGSQMIDERNLQNKATFIADDAFNEKSLAEITPQPTLGIVSGLYELFPDNSMLKASLSGLSKAIPQNGYLIYTNQPWHPQVELIARTLSSHQQKGKPWVMRRRTQAEMDQLVENAGFEKIDQLIDEWGIFTVSVAKKK